MRLGGSHRLSDPFALGRQAVSEHPLGDLLPLNRGRHEVGEEVRSAGETGNVHAGERGGVMNVGPASVAGQSGLARNESPSNASLSSWPPQIHGLR